MKLCWFRNIEQDFPLWETSVHKISRDKYLKSLNKECQRYEKGHLEIRKKENKRCKIFNKVLNMNWDYVRGKKKQKENKNKQTKRKQTNKLKLKNIKK